MKTLNIEIPKGYEIDKDKSTFEKIIFKEIKKEFDYHSIRSYEDACRYLHENIILNSCDEQDEMAYKKLKLIIKAINNGWTPDWNNHNQKKWYIYWSVLSSGFGFSYTYFGYGYTDTTVGSLLCFESREKAEYTAKTFMKLFEAFYL